MLFCMNNQQITEIFGDVVRETRKSKGISQEKLAQLAEIDRAYMGKIERGQAKPSFPTILSISKALGVKASDLVKAFEKKIK